MIQGLMNQSLRIYARTGVDRYGNHEGSTGVTVRCRFELTSKTITTKDNEREPVDGIVFVGPSVTVNVGDRVRYNSRDYRVLRMSEVVGGTGKTHHKELMVQLWKLA